MTPEDIKRRAEAIRLPIKALAQRAALDEDNVHRVLKGKTDPRRSTETKLQHALVCEEERLRDYLCELHGAPDAKGGEQ